jgi:hypothetical protein
VRLGARGPPGKFVPNLVPNRAELTATRDHETVPNIALQSQIHLDRGACKAVYTGSIPVVASVGSSCKPSRRESTASWCPAIAPARGAGELRWWRPGIGVPRRLPRRDESVVPLLEYEPVVLEQFPLEADLVRAHA